MKKIHLAYIIVIIIASCTPSARSDSEFPTIDIEEGLGNFQISQLSEFASSVRYVRLETHEACLVTNGIKNIYVEDLST